MRLSLPASTRKVRVTEAMQEALGELFKGCRQKSSEVGAIVSQLGASARKITQY